MVTNHLLSGMILQVAANIGVLAEDFSPHDLFVIPKAGKDGLPTARWQMAIGTLTKSDRVLTVHLDVSRGTAWQV